MFPISDVIPSRTRPVVTMALIALNSLAYLYQLRVDEPTHRALLEDYAVVPAAWSFGQLVTSMFLHADILHFATNMVFLWIFGDNVEDRLGHLRFLLFYLLAGVAAGITHIVVNSGSAIPSIGASGAIAGVLAAYLRLFPRAEVRTLLFIGPFIAMPRLSAALLIGFWFVTQLFAGVTSLGAETEQTSGVAFWAHIGGFVAGLVLAQFMAPPRSQSRFSLSD